MHKENCEQKRNDGMSLHVSKVQSKERPMVDTLNNTCYSGVVEAFHEDRWSGSSLPYPLTLSNCRVVEGYLDRFGVNESN